jgi:hypothetical protein
VICRTFLGGKLKLQTCSACQDLPTLQFLSKFDYPSSSYCPFFIIFFYNFNTFRLIFQKLSFWLKIEQFWPFEEISIFSNGGHLGYRTALTDTILKGDHLRIISAKFG